MAERTVTIRISAQDSFSSVFKQYQQAVGQAAADTQQLNKSSDESSSGINNLSKAVGDAITGFIAFKAVGMVSELVHLGGAANATQATFTALSGGAAEATNTLIRMRDATGGIVADTELMAGANRLLAMHIANTGQQAADLAGVAVNLGRAFGQDAASAIENFSLMIANQSLLRLDSLGISASAVRARMAELKDEFPEMDKQARFTQATLEEATKTVDRLGSSITAAQTPIAQLETRFENFKTNVGQTLSTTLNNAITTFEQLGTIIQAAGQYGFGDTVRAATQGDEFYNNQLRTKIAAQQDTQSIYDTVIRDFNGGANSDFILDFVVTALQEVRDNPALKNNTEELARTVMMDLVESGKTYEDANSELASTIATGVIQIGASNQALRDQKQAALDAAAAFYAYDEAFAPTQDAHVNETLQNRISLINQSQQAVRDFYATDEAFAPTAVAHVNDVAQERVAAMKRALDAAKATYSAAMSDMTMTTGAALGNVFQYQGGLNAGLASPMGGPLTMMQSLTDFQVSAMPDYLRPEQAEQLAAAYSDAEAEFEKLKALNEEGLISDDQLSQAETMKDNIKTMADEAKRAADNFANMKLPDAFGQTGGGMAGQITDDVIKRMKDSGNYTDEQIAQFQQTAGLATGTETQASIAYQEQVLPMIQQIYDQGGADAAAQAMLNVQTYLQNAKLQGISPSEIAKNLPNSTGYSYVAGGAGGAGGQTFTIKPGQTPGEIAAQLGVPVSQVIGAAGATSAYNVQPGTYTLGGGVAPIPGFTPGMMGVGGEGAQHGTEAGQDMSKLQDGYEEIATSTDTMRENFDSISSQMQEIGDKASAFNDTLDLASAARNMLFTVNLQDNTKGFLQLMLNSQQFGTLNFTGGGADSGGAGGNNTRNNGGRVPGVDGRVGQRPGFG